MNGTKHHKDAQQSRIPPGGLPEQCHGPGTLAGVLDVLRARACWPSGVNRGYVRQLGLAHNATLAIVFAVMAALAWNGRVSGLERRLTGDLAQLPGSVGLETGDVLSLVGSAGVVTVVAVVLVAAVWRRSGDALLAGAVPLAVGIADVADLAAKHIVGRLRPTTAVFTGETGFGFPSGPTARFVAMAVVALIVLSARPEVRRRGLDVTVAAVSALDDWLQGVSVVVGEE